MKDILIREYKEGDEFQIVELFKKAFNEELSLEEWKWKYKENPEGFLSFVGTKNNKIIVHYGMPYVKLKIKEKLVRAVSAGDTMVHPDYQGRKGGRLAFLFLFSLGASSPEEGWRYLGARYNISVGFGFPNERVYKVGKRYGGYKDIGELYVVRKYLVRGWRRSKIIREASRLYYKIEFIYRKALFAKRNIKRIKEFGKEVDQLWEKVKKNYPIAVVRDSRYLNWRYRKRPLVSYILLSAQKGAECKGWIVLRIKEEKIGDLNVKVGYILDMLADDKRVIKNLILHSIDLFFKKGVYLLEAWSSLNEKKIFEELGFSVNRRIPLVWHPFSIEDQGEINFISDIKNWYITLGDALSI